MLTDVTLDKPLDAVDRPAVPFRLAALTALIALSACALMAASVWFIKRQSLRTHNLRSARVTQWVQSNAQKFVDDHVKGLATVTQLYAGSAPVTKEQFKDLAGDTLRQNAGFTALNYVNKDFIVEEVYPYAANRTALRMDLKSRFDVLPVAHRAISHREVSTTDLLDLVQGGKGIILYAPIFQENRWGGLIEGVLKIDDFTTAFLEKDLGPDYNYTVIDETNGKEVYTSLPPTAYERSTPYDTYFTLRLGDRTWWVILHPKSPPMVLLPLVFLLVLELGLAALGVYLLWKNHLAAPAS